MVFFLLNLLIFDLYAHAQANPMLETATSAVLQQIEDAKAGLFHNGTY